jgi:hypothetical protein
MQTAAVKEAVGNIMKYQTFYPSDAVLREAVASLHGYPDYSAVLRASPMLVASTLKQVCMHFVPDTVEPSCSGCQSQLADL